MDQKAKIRVLFISHDCGSAGAELSLVGLLQSLDRARFEPFVIAPCGGELKNRLEELDIDFHPRSIQHWIPYSYRYGIPHAIRFITTFPTRIRSLVSFIKANDIDIVYTNTVTVLDGAVAAFFSKRPHIWHLREKFSNNSDLRAYLPRFITRTLVKRLAHKVIVNSNSLRADFDRHTQSSDTTVIYNGIDVDRFSQALSVRGRLIAELGLPAKASIIGSVAQLSPRKDIPTLFRAFAALLSSGIDAALLLPGKGREEYVRELRKLAHELGITHRVFFLGLRHDIPELMKSFDILVLSSIEEPFGRVLVEGMAAQKPVVATRSGGPAEIVIDGETGFLVPVGDFTAMGARLAQLIEDPHLAERFGMAAKSRADTVFRLGAYVGEVTKVLEEVHCMHGAPPIDRSCA